MVNFGLRYERLLMLTAPISLAALFVLAVSAASASQSELIRASCYEAAASAIESKRGDLDQEWNRVKPATKDLGWGIDYILKVTKSIIGPATHECFGDLLKQSDQRFRNSPSDIVGGLRKEAEFLRKAPMRLYGIEMPETAQLDLFGIKFNVRLLSISRALQIVLAPVLLLWLSSLYNTRHREGIALASAKNIAEAFPHVINIYPIGELQSPRRRTWYAAHVHKMVAAIYALIRILLLSLFIGPPVASYIASLVFSATDEYFGYFLTLGCLVGLFALVNLLGEFFPWHFLKIFSPPEQYKADRR